LGQGLLAGCGFSTGPKIVILGDPCGLCERYTPGPEGSDRYEEIPTRPSGQGYRAMIDFTGRVKDARLRSRLESVLHGKGAFRRFKDTLREFPEVEEKWFRFKAEKDKADVKDWLESIGIELRRSESSGIHPVG